MAVLPSWEGHLRLSPVTCPVVRRRAQRFVAAKAKPRKPAGRSRVA
jgi:hypothetical protein